MIKNNSKRTVYRNVRGKYKIPSNGGSFIKKIFVGFFRLIMSIFTFNVLKNYYFLLFFGHIIFLVVMVIFQLTQYDWLIGLIYLIALSHEIYYAAMTRPTQMMRKTVGQWLAASTLAGGIACLVFAYLGVSMVELFTEIPLYFYATPVLAQILDVVISAKLKPLYMRHFDNANDNFPGND